MGVQREGQQWWRRPQAGGGGRVCCWHVQAHFWHTGLRGGRDSLHCHLLGMRTARVLPRGHIRLQISTRQGLLRAARLLCQGCFWGPSHAPSWGSACRHCPAPPPLLPLNSALQCLSIALLVGNGRLQQRRQISPNGVGCSSLMQVEHCQYPWSAEVCRGDTRMLEGRERKEEAFFSQGRVGAQELQPLIEGPSSNHPSKSNPE